jgi:hypothetical protein
MAVDIRNLHAFNAELDAIDARVKREVAELIEQNNRDLRFAQALVIFTSALGAALMVLSALA